MNSNNEKGIATIVLLLGIVVIAVLVLLAILGSGILVNQTAKNCTISSLRPCYDKQTGKKIIGLESKGGENAFGACIKNSVFLGTGESTTKTSFCEKEKYQYCYEGKSKVFLREFKGECKIAPSPLAACPEFPDFQLVGTFSPEWSPTNLIGDDIGESWQATFIRSRTGTLFAGGYKWVWREAEKSYAVVPEIFRSNDNGKTWEVKELPYNYTDTSVFAITEDQNGVLYAGGWGLWKSVDGGDSWQTLLMPGASLPDYQTFFIYDFVSTKDGALVASVGKGIYNGPGYLFKSTDGGQSWQEITEVYSCMIISIVEAADGGMVFMDCYGEMYRYHKDIFSQITFRPSYPYGVSGFSHDRPMLKAKDGTLYLIAMDPATPPVDSGGLSTTELNGKSHLVTYKSTDNGINWSKVGSTLPYSLIPQPLLEADDGTLYAGAYTTCGLPMLYKSTDKAKTWSVVADGPSYLYQNYPFWYTNYLIEVEGRILHTNAGAIYSSP